MTDETDSAGTPPAPEGGNEKMLTQSEVNAIVEDRLARQKKQFANYSDLKKDSEELAELKKSQMTELEQLKASLVEKDALLQSKDQELTGLKLQQTKIEKLTAAGLLPTDAKYVNGSTEEEIDASIADLAARLKVEPPKAAQGAGQTGIQSQAKPNNKVWTQSEIKELRLSGKLTDEVMAEIKQATADGRVQ